jgi:hypothetical protein
MKANLIVPPEVQVKLLEIIREATKDTPEEKFGDNLDLLPKRFGNKLNELNNIYTEYFIYKE